MGSVTVSGGGTTAKLVTSGTAIAWNGGGGNRTESISISYPGSYTSNDFIFCITGSNAEWERRVFILLSTSISYSNNTITASFSHHTRNNNTNVYYQIWCKK